MLSCLSRRSACGRRLKGFQIARIAALDDSSENAAGRSLLETSRDHRARPKRDGDAGGRRRRGHLRRIDTAIRVSSDGLATSPCTSYALWTMALVGRVASVASEAGYRQFLEPLRPHLPRFLQWRLRCARALASTCPCWVSCPTRADMALDSRCGCGCQYFAYRHAGILVITILKMVGLIVWLTWPSFSSHSHHHPFILTLARTIRLTGRSVSLFGQYTAVRSGSNRIPGRDVLGLGPRSLGVRDDF